MHPRCRNCCSTLDFASFRYFAPKFPGSPYVVFRLFQHCTNCTHHSLEVDQESFDEMYEAVQLRISSLTEERLQFLKDTKQCRCFTLINGNIRETQIPLIHEDKIDFVDDYETLTR